MKRIVMAGLLGGIAMFIWSSLAHVVLPLGQTGIKEIPNEQAAISALQTSLGQASGLYFYPAMGSDSAATYAHKLAASPSGILIYHPAGAANFSMGQLGVEFVTELIEALLAAWLLSLTAFGGFGSRVGFVCMLGILASITTNISYWNWYGFPANYTAVYMFMQVVGYLCAGLVIASMVKPAAARMAVAA